MDKVYLYDGSFEGFLTIVFITYEEKKVPSKIFIEEDYISNMFESVRIIETKKEKSERVKKGIINKIGSLSFYKIYTAFLNNDKEKEINILKYIIDGFKYGSKVQFLRDRAYVTNIQKLSKNTTMEAHRLKGFVRFNETKEGLLYSKIEPDNDVLEILMKHFSTRLKTFPFIIHDVKRKKCGIYNQGKMSIVGVDDKEIIKIEKSDDDKKYIELWKCFFNSVGIKERKNNRCQMTFMPKKYWKYMFEMEDKL